MDFLQELYERGLINNITNQEKIKEFFNKKNKALYVGFDPTAISLHLGNYVMISLLKRFKNNGFNVYAVLGGATGMIGDPSGKASERNLLSLDVIKNNSENIKNQLIKFCGATIFNNYSIYENMNILEFLRDIGKNINVNHVLERDIVRKRLEVGISLTEFTYSVLQGYDFYYLYKNNNVSLQMGGSDQWSNITAGIDYIRKQYNDKSDACGMTINLLVKSDGTKFGKSEKGAIYLDKNLTSPYEMYQFLLNQSDSDVSMLLKFLSFKSLNEINEILSLHAKEPFKKLAQKELANEIVSTIHGEQELKNVIKISNAIFNNKIDELDPNEIKVAFKNVPNYVCEKNEINIVDLLVESQIISSKKMARELIDGKSIYVNNQLVNGYDLMIAKKDSYNNEFSLIRKGKKNYFLIIWK